MKLCVTPAMPKLDSDTDGRADAALMGAAAATEVLVLLCAASHGSAVSRHRMMD